MRYVVALIAALMLSPHSSVSVVVAGFVFVAAPEVAEAGKKKNKPRDSTETQVKILNAQMEADLKADTSLFKSEKKDAKKDEQQQIKELLKLDLLIQGLVAELEIPTSSKEQIEIYSTALGVAEKDTLEARKALAGVIAEMKDFRIRNADFGSMDKAKRRDDPRSERYDELRAKLFNALSEFEKTEKLEADYRESLARLEAKLIASDDNNAQAGDDNDNDNDTQVLDQDTQVLDQLKNLRDKQIAIRKKFAPHNFNNELKSAKEWRAERDSALAAQAHHQITQLGQQLTNLSVVVEVEKANVQSAAIETLRLLEKIEEQENILPTPGNVDGISANIRNLNDAIGDQSRAMAASKGNLDAAKEHLGQIAIQREQWFAGDDNNAQQDWQREQQQQVVDAELAAAEAFQLVDETRLVFKRALHIAFFQALQAQKFNSNLWGALLSPGVWTENDDQLLVFARKNIAALAERRIAGVVPAQPAPPTQIYAGFPQQIAAQQSLGGGAVRSTDDN